MFSLTIGVSEWGAWYGSGMGGKSSNSNGARVGIACAMIFKLVRLQQLSMKSCQEFAFSGAVVDEQLNYVSVSTKEQTSQRQ